MLLAIFQRTPEGASGHVQPKLSNMKPRRPIIVQAFREASNIFKVNKQFYIHFTSTNSYITLVLEITLKKNTHKHVPRRGVISDAQTNMYGIQRHIRKGLNNTLSRELCFIC